MSTDFKARDYDPFTVFQFENFSRPENHHYLWVMTDKSGNGNCVHVVAPYGAPEFKFEVKDLRPEDSFNVEKWEVLGKISESQYNRLIEVCEKEVQVPVKEGDGRPNATVGDCRTWMNEAVQRLHNAGILKEI